MTTEIDMRNFKLEEYLASFDARIFDYAESRREATKYNPLLFALTYLPHHLSDESTGGQITFNEFHLTLTEHAKDWALPLKLPQEFRDAYIAPRGCGKSTWVFLILPMWAAAHKHVSFIAAFSDSASQAQEHLDTFRTELETNKVLRNDYPDLCAPKKRAGVARSVADSRTKIHRNNDFVFMAKGIDASNLGMKVGSRRPQLILLDDVEKGASNYSAYQVKQRLRTMQDDIFPMNVFARVVIVGTTTMSGSIMHQLKRIASGETQEAEELEWIEEENLEVHYFPALITNDDGTERSIWPEKWSLEYLKSISGTRSFQKNFQNDPIAEDGQFWEQEDFIYRDDLPIGATLISIDPAVTKTKVSDYTGLAIISRTGKREVSVRYATHLKLGPEDLVDRLRTLIVEYNAGLILIETNQGGDLWKRLLSPLPCKIKTIHQSESKNVRAERALMHYQRSRVTHEKKHTILENEMLNFPNALHDDTLDAAVTGILFFLEPKRSGRTKTKQMSYV